MVDTRVKLNCLNRSKIDFTAGNVTPCMQEALTSVNEINIGKGVTGNGCG